MQDKIIDMLYHEIGDTAMILQVRWWISAYPDNRRVHREYTALQEAIDGAGLGSSVNTQTIDLQINPKAVVLLKELSSESVGQDQEY